MPPKKTRTPLARVWLNRAMRWWVLLLYAATCQAQGPAAIRNFLVADAPRAELWLQTADIQAAIPKLSQLRSPVPLAAGFHVLDLHGWEPAFRYVAVVPRGEVPPTGRPLVVATPPGLTSLAPSELGVRAAYGPFLEAGCCVMVPVAAHLMGVPISAKDARPRRPWSSGRDHIPALIADLGLRTHLDRERVVMMPRWTDQPSTLNQPIWHDLDATPFAAAWVLLPGSSTPPPPPDPDRWAGRQVVYHTSSHRRDRLTLAAGRLRALKPPARVDVLIDDGIDWSRQCMLDPGIVRKGLTPLRRARAQDTLTFHAGAPHPGTHEWFSAPDAKDRIHVHRSAGRVEITTPDSPTRTPFPMDIWFATDPGALTVLFNGRPIHGGPVPHDGRAALRCLRREARSGRVTRRVLQVRP